MVTYVPVNVFKTLFCLIQLTCWSNYVYILSCSVLHSNIIEIITISDKIIRTIHRVYHHQHHHHQYHHWRWRWYDHLHSRILESKHAHSTILGENHPWFSRWRQKKNNRKNDKNKKKKRYVVANTQCNCCLNFSPVCRARK